MKRLISAVLAMAVAMVSLQGCYGKMALTKKVYKLNGEVSDKYLRSLVTWVFVIVPVYGVSALADFVLFNTIEFWSGNNPIASAEKEFQYSENGQTYKVHARNHYSGDTYLDTLAIVWDTSSGNSKATLHQSGKVTEYLAVMDKGGVRVTSSADGHMSRMLATAMLHR